MAGDLVRSGSGKFVAARSGSLGDVWKIDFEADGRLYVAGLHHNRVAHYSVSAEANQGGAAKSGYGPDTGSSGGLASHGSHF